MNKSDTDLLESLVDRWTLEEVLESLSYICGEKAEYIAVNWQDTELAKRWMLYSQRLDTLSAEFNKRKVKASD